MLTVYGIETFSLSFHGRIVIVATAPTVHGIETFLDKQIRR